MRTQPAARSFFISHSHAERAEVSLAKWFHDALLRAGHHSFIDAGMPLGVKWSQEVERNLDQCDYFVVLLSEAAVNSEMVIEEVRRANALHKKHQRPQLIPLLIRYDGDFGYHLGAIINPLQWGRWEGEKDSEPILQKILQLVGGAQPSPTKRRAVKSPPKAESLSPSPMASPTPGSAIRNANRFYIERRVEKILMEDAATPGETITIEAPRQIGKSSLLQRYVTAAQSAGQRIALVDFSLFNEFHFSRYEDLMRQIADRVCRALGVKQTGAPEVGDSVKFTNWIEEQILLTIAEPVVLAFDEADAVFDYAYRRDFFKMLRSWQNLRAINSNWEKLGLAMVISTERNLLVDNATTSPFNIGRHVRLQPFNAEECLQLNQRFQQFAGDSLDDGQVRRLHDLLRGQPYLTYQALNAVIREQSLTLDDLIETAADDDGLFADHLRALLVRLSNRADYGLAAVFRQILDGKTVTDRLAVGRLKAAGLVRAERGQSLPANQLYEQFFGRAL